MLNLFDHLTELDNKRIENYIKKWGCEDYVGNSIYLRDWASNNKKLFHLLDGKLILEKKIDIIKNEEAMKTEMSNFFYNCNFFDEFSDFINNCIMSLPKEDRMNEWNNVAPIYSITSTDLVNNSLSKPVVLNWNKNKKSIKMSAGTKIMKAISKTLDYMDVSSGVYERYEEMRIKHSMILNDKHLKGTLCLSIHPLDFLTMSDNDSNWNSCMSWENYGCYHAGTVEMMNSNCVICAYLKSNSQPEYDMLREGIKDLPPEKTWNNKKWRQLIYCTKDILLAGKAYPYVSKELTFMILNWLKELSIKNWKNDYAYGIERYEDMKHIRSNFKMERNKYWIHSKNYKKHNIIMDTKLMYNDMFNDSSYWFYCYRNKVKKNTVLCVSGKMVCACCGDNDYRIPIDKLDYEDIDYYNKHGEGIDTDELEWTYNDKYIGTKRIMCMPCYINHECSCCSDGDNDGGPVSKIVKLKEEDVEQLENHAKKLCKRCFTTNLFFCPTCGKIYYKSWSERYSKVFGILDKYYDKKDTITKFDDIDMVVNEFRNDKTSESKVRVFNECTSCTTNRKKHSTYESIRYSFIKNRFYSDTIGHYWFYDTPVTEEEMKKYELNNLEHLTEEDFEDYYAGIATFKDLEEKYRKKLKNI